MREIKIAAHRIAGNIQSIIQPRSNFKYLDIGVVMRLSSRSMKRLVPSRLAELRRFSSTLITRRYEYSERAAAVCSRILRPIPWYHIKPRIRAFLRFPANNRILVG